MTGRPPGPSVDELTTGVLAGDRRSAGRLISLIEAGDAAIEPVLATLYARGTGTPVIGITGPPGAGKSTLADQLIALWRQQGERIAVLAVDPSSPVSGGAILGDRIRMRRHSTDSGVFIRSMAARNSLGGLAGAAGDALIVLAAMGFDRILVETVGVGQSEIDILHHADTVVVVQTPAGGDNVQAMKSGLLEIADIFVVNKMDAPGADRTVAFLTETVEQGGMSSDGWHVPVLKSQASDGTGIAAIDDAMRAHLQHLESHPAEQEARRRKRARALLVARLIEMIRARYALPSGLSTAFEDGLQDVLARRSTPRGAAARLLKEMP